MRLKRSKITLGFKEGKPEAFVLRRQNIGRVEFDELKELVEQRSSVKGSTVGLVMEDMLNTITFLLSKGFIVKLGDMCSLSINVSCEITEDVTKAAAKNIRRAKFEFRPGKKLRQTLKDLKVEVDGSLTRVYDPDIDPDPDTDPDPDGDNGGGGTFE